MSEMRRAADWPAATRRHCSGRPAQRWRARRRFLNIPTARGLLVLALWGAAACGFRMLPIQSRPVCIGQGVPMAIARQLKVTLDNRPGALAQVCSELAKRAINIQAIEAREVRPTGAVRLLVNQFETARGVCEALGLKCVEEPVLAVKVGDRPGALGRITRKLAEKGINIEYLYGTIEKGAKQALIVMGVSDLEAAARVAR